MLSIVPLLPDLSYFPLRGVKGFVTLFEFFCILSLIYFWNLNSVLQDGQQSKGELDCKPDNL